MKLIESKTLGTAQASIEFTSIPQTYTDLVFIASCRTDRAAVDDPILIQINGGSTAASNRRLRGSGSGVVSQNSSIDGNYYWFSNGASATSNTFDNASIYFPNYTSAANKSFSVDGVGENNATTAFQTITAGLWANTAAITSVKFQSDLGTNLVAGTTISLYGVLKGTDGIVTTSP
jgi:hypothetical protein